MEENLMENDINGSQPQLKMTTLACLASQFCSELGPAQPQLVLKFYQQTQTNTKRHVVVGK